MSKDRVLLGKKGELIAKNYLIRQGYKVLESNYRVRFGEIDLIVEQDQCLIFVEVRAKSSLRFGRPEESIRRNKVEKIRKVAETYILRHRHLNKEIRFDVITIHFTSDGNMLRLNHFKEAF